MTITGNATGLQHIGLPTAAFDKTMAFYTELGFAVCHETTNPNTQARVAFLRLGGLVLETYEQAATAGKPGAIEHIALNVQDVDTLYKSALASGHSIVEDGVQFLPFWEKGVRFFTIVGPGGEKIEFNQIL